MPAPPCPQCEQARHLLALIAVDDLDAAIEAGLMAYVPCARCEAADRDALDPLVRTQARLRDAWDARERYRQRNARLARRAAEREARRPPAPRADALTPPRPAALPSAAADILARAKAKAAERMKR
jgi:hypothetical protein